MIWTESGCTINVAPTEAGTAIIDRTKNTAVLKLSVAQTVGLIKQLTDNLGANGVPTRLHYEGVLVVIENPDGFHLKDME